jgi:hypothetical protein
MSDVTPLGGLGFLKHFAPTVARAVVLGFCALTFLSPAAATRIFDWAIRAEAGRIAGTTQQVLRPAFEQMERAEAASQRESAREAQRRALRRARRQAN